MGTKYEDLAREVSSIAPETHRDLFTKAANESEKIGVAGSPDYVCYHGWTFKIRDAKRAEDIGAPALRPAANWMTLRAKARTNLIAEVAR